MTFAALDTALADAAQTLRQAGTWEAQERYGRARRSYRNTHSDTIGAMGAREVRLRGYVLAPKL